MIVSEPTHTVDVAGIGAFTFKRKTRIRNQIAMEAEYESVIGGIGGVSERLEIVARAYAGVKTLTVSAPDGWNLDELNLLDEADADRLMTVWKAVLEREAFFRSGGAQERAPGR